MNREQVQKQLNSIYEDWKASLDYRVFDADYKRTKNRMSPPLLLKVTDAYWNASVKLIIYGQETNGWGWTREQQKKLPNAGDYPYKDISTLLDFIENKDSIEALLWRYENAKYTTPIWRAFRELEKGQNVGAMRSNLIRSDYNGGSIFKADDRIREAFLPGQTKLMREELAVLGPHVCMFLTGPNYDVFLKGTFPQMECRRVDAAIPECQLARLTHGDLPQKSYRTYHPGHLTRCSKWFYLDLLRRSARLLDFDGRAGIA